MSKETSISQQYGFNNHINPTDIVQIEQSKVMQEVQAKLVIAKKFLRDSNKSFSKIMESCKRPFLAEQAIYAYPRGGKVVTGPSIRLAEVLAQNWGNLDFGVKEISRINGVSVAEAYAWDLETNVCQTKLFHVSHKRDKKGAPSVLLTDERDIYELVANNGARRMRACILGVIPGDIADAAVEACKKTLSSGKEPIADRIRQVINAFSEYGIKVEQIEKKLGHNLDATIESELVTLRAIYKSIKDGMAAREDFFDFSNLSKELEDKSIKKSDRIANKFSDRKSASDNSQVQQSEQIEKQPLTTDTKAWIDDFDNAKNRNGN